MPPSRCVAEDPQEKTPCNGRPSYPLAYHRIFARGMEGSSARPAQ